MAVLIRRMSGEPRYDSIPVAKITDYPLEKESYMPFAQCQLCLNGEGLTIRIWAFEVDPPKESALRISFGTGEHYLTLTVYSDDRYVYAADGSPCELPVSHHSIAGEDLQGIYWGAVLFIPTDALLSVLDVAQIDTDTVIRGNLYKLSDAEGWSHYGSHYPVDFTSADPYGPAYFDKFSILSY